MSSIPDRSAPEHPAWCDREHAPRAGHSATVAMEPLEVTSVRVGLFRWSRDVITVDLRLQHIGEDLTALADGVEDNVGVVFSPDAARRVARRLVEAADLLDGER